MSDDGVCHSVELPPLSPELASMVRVFELDKRDKSKVEKVEQTRKELENIFLEYHGRANRSFSTKEKRSGSKKVLSKSASVGDLSSQSSGSPIVQFLRQKYTRVCRKLTTEHRRMSENCSIEASILMVTFDQLLKSGNFGAQLNMPKFREHLANKLKSPAIRKLTFKKEALMTKICEDVPEKTKSLAEIRKKLKEVRTEVPDDKWALVPGGEFEKDFRSFTRGDTNEKLRAAVSELCGTPIDGQSESVAKNAKPNFEPLADLLRVYVVKLEVKDNDKAARLVKSVLFSVVFDMVATIDKTLSKWSEEMVKNASFIQKMTPKELKMPTWFAGEADFETPLEELRVKDKQIDKMARDCCSLCFITSPLDLAKSVMRLSYEISGRKKGAGRMLDFDEIIICMIGIVALDPPPNALGISDWMQKYIPQSLSPQLSQAATLFSASVEFIRDFDPSDVF